MVRTRASWGRSWGGRKRAWQSQGARWGLGRRCTNKGHVVANDDEEWKGSEEGVDGREEGARRKGKAVRAGADKRKRRDGPAAGPATGGRNFRWREGDRGLVWEARCVSKARGRDPGARSQDAAQSPSTSGDAASGATAISYATFTALGGLVVLLYVLVC